MKRYVLAIQLVMCLSLFGCRDLSQSDVTVKNISNSTLKEVRISICGKTFVIKDLATNEEQKFYYAVKSDSGYLVEVVYHDDRKLEKKEGYVTRGFVFHDFIAIDSNDITVVYNEE